MPLAHKKPVVIEICPRSTLKALGYAKASTTDVLSLLEHHAVDIAEQLREMVLSDAGGDAGGDARDSVIAAFAAWRAAGESLTSADFNVLEGHVFV